MQEPRLDLGGPCPDGFRAVEGRRRVGSVARLRTAETRVVKSSRAQEFGAAGNIDYNTTHTKNTANGRVSRDG
jgi:hypothetical protein